MSSEVCPFCGKLFKRLKAHLPHCKAADHSKTAPNTNNVTLSGKKTSPLSASKPTSPLLEKITKKSKKLASSTATQVRKSTLASSSSATLPPPSQSSPQSTSPTPLRDGTGTSSSSSLPPSTPSSTGSVLPPTPKKKKQKLADQMATLSSSSPISSSSSPPPHPLASSPSLSKTKKKESLRALIEATMLKQVPERASEGTKPTSDLLLISTPTESITSRAPSLTGSQTGPDTDSGKTAPVSKDLKSEKRAPRKKGPLKEKAGLSTTRASSASRDFEGLGGGNGTRPDVNVLEDNYLSGKERLRGPGSGHQARVTLQDVATLGRSNISYKNGNRSILDQIQMTPIQTPDTLKTRGPLTVHLNQTSLSTQNRNEHVAGLPGQLAATRPQAAELSTVKTESTEEMKPKQVSLVPLQKEGGLSAPLKSLVCLEGGLNVSSHKVGLLSASPTIAKLMEGGALPSVSSSSSPLPRPQPLPLSTLYVGAGTVRANERLMLDRSRLGIRKPAGILMDRKLGEVRLGELHEWLALKTPCNPREALGLLQGGWQWYQRKYIHVKKGGIGGVAMLLAGYCVLSYIWCYPHIKRDRWRKYH